MRDDLKAQQPGKMWSGAGAVQPSVTPAPPQTVTTSRSHMANRVLPGVALLLLFCCCYLFTEAVRWDERGEGFARKLLDEEVVFLDDLAQSGRPAECRASPADRGRAGRAICGTGMVDVAQLVCLVSNGARKSRHCGWFSSPPDPCLVTLLFTPIHGEKVHLCMSQHINAPKIWCTDQSSLWTWLIQRNVTKVKDI